MPGSFPESPGRNSSNATVQTHNQGSDNATLNQRWKAEYEEIAHLKRALSEMDRRIDHLLEGQGYFKGVSVLPWRGGATK